MNIMEDIIDINAYLLTCSNASHYYFRINCFEALNFFQTIPLLQVIFCINVAFWSNNPINVLIFKTF